MTFVRTAIGLIVVLGCHREAPAADQQPPVAPIAAPLAVGKTEPAKAPPATSQKLDPKLLDAALAAKKIAAADVIKRASTATSAWAIAITKRNDLKEPAEYAVIRVRVGETAEVRIAPPKGQKRLPSFDAIVSFEARDLDGDGVDEGILVATWKRQVREGFPKCGDCVQITTEEADQLYVLGGAGTKLETGFTHLVSYKSDTDSLPEANDLPTPTSEEVTYTWSIDGKPPVVKLTLGKQELSKVRRVKGTVDPASDPLLAGTKQAAIAFP